MLSQGSVIRISVKGLRTLADVTLDLRGLTVLIGDNGTGKSSLIEACELLRLVASGSFQEDLFRTHGGMSSLLRFGERRIELGARVGSEHLYAEYTLVVDADGDIELETLDEVEHTGSPEDASRTSRTSFLVRDGQQVKFRVGGASDELIDLEKRIDRRQPALVFWGSGYPSWPVNVVADGLRGIDVHLPFDTTALWAHKRRGQPAPLRTTTLLEPADSLSRFGENLANAYQALKNDFSEVHWQETMGWVRLGLGSDLESINVRVDPGGGAVALRVKYAGFEQQVPAFALSDGTLTYLAFVALARLNTGKSLIAFDEPETHLHPELLMRVLDLFESLARERPVLLSTHSDRLLDGLSDPAGSVVLCELDERRETALLRPDPVALGEWLGDYRGLGDIRSSGHARSVLTRRASR